MVKEYFAFDFKNFRDYLSVKKSVALIFLGVEYKCKKIKQSSIIWYQQVDFRANEETLLEISYTR